MQIPLPVIPCSPLCPVTSVLHALSFTSGSPPYFHAFAYFDVKLLRPKVFTYRSFLSKLRQCLQTLDYNPHDYAGHSFRIGGGEGGASHAFQSGVPVDLIKLLGNWKSDAVFMYLPVPLKVRLDTIKLISNSLSQ